MKSADQRELEQLALAAELAGQLRHDVGSFVYHLNLKLDLLEALPDQPADWTSIKREARELIQMLREWDDVRGCPVQATEIELNQLAQEVVKKVYRRGLQSRIALKLAPASTLLLTRAGEARRLFHLLMHHAITSSRAADENGWRLLVETHVETESMQFCIGGVASNSGLALLDEDDGNPPSLTIKACRSLGVRLGAKIRTEQQADGKMTMVVEFERVDAGAVAPG